MGDKKASLPWIPTGPCSALFYYYFLLLFLFVCFFLSFRSCFPCGSASKESMCNVGDLDSIPGFRRSSGEGKGYLLQYSGLENSMGYIVHGVSKSRTRRSDFHWILDNVKGLFTFLGVLRALCLCFCLLTMLY